MKLKKRNGIYYVDLRSIGKGRLSTRTGDIVQARVAVKQILEGINCVNNEDYSLGMLIRRALSDHYEPLHPKGIKGHRSQLYCIEAELEEGRVLLKNINMGYLIDYRNRLMRCGILRHSTINKRLGKLKRVLELAVGWQWIEQLPIFPAELAYHTDRHRELSEYEQEFILRFFEGPAQVPWMSGLVSFLLETGCRVGEAFGLEDADIASARTSRILTLRDTKGGGDLRVPLSLLAGEALLKAEWLGYTIRQAQYQWDKARAALGLTEDAGFVIHSLRHTFASRMLQRGVALATISGWLGHSTTVMTELYARHSDESMLQLRDDLPDVPY